MIERIIEFSIRRRWLVIAAAALLAIAGVAAIHDTPVDAIPDLSENQVIVFTPWEGHGAEAIETQITSPLSVRLQGLPDVKAVRGSSDVNFSLIHVIFEDGVSVETARQQVTQRLDRAGQELPADAAPHLAPESPATGQIFWYTVDGRNLDLRELREIQDSYVRPQLSTVPGVAEVASIGGFVGEYQIEVDPLRLQLYGATLAEVVKAVGGSNPAAAARVMQRSGAEHVSRPSSSLGEATGIVDAHDLSVKGLIDLENVVVSIGDGRSIRLGDIASARLGPQPRHGVFEKDGNEVVGGVISMRFGENPLALTERIKSKIDDLQLSLPVGVRIVPVYDRTPLIQGAIHTVTRTLLEAIIAASVCVVIVLLHVRTSLVIAVTLPLATLSAFLAIWLLRRTGIANIETNIMTLAGIVVSIGVLVDASIVMAENAMFTLHRRFSNQKVRGDTRALLLPACKTVGRPIFFSILIMLLSFFPVFALEGAAGKMFRPLAITKSAALVAAAILAITLVPALCTLLVRGRLRNERESWLVRSVMDVYRPVLNNLLTNPAPLFWILAATMIVGSAPLGNRWLSLGMLLIGILMIGMLARTPLGRVAGFASLIVLALSADQNIRPLQQDLITPLSEGMAMDMPITVPLTSIAESTDDLKARDMILCRFPEVAMVVGKAGRAETPTDPAPLDMIETMIEFRPEQFWPRRKIRLFEAERHSRVVLDELIERQLIAPPGDEAACRAAATEAASQLLPRFDALMREYAYQRNEDFSRGLASQLNRYLVERCVAMLWQNGKLSRQPSTSDLTLTSADVPAETRQTMRQGPNSYAIGRIMQSVSTSLVRLQLALPDTDLFAIEPGPVGRAMTALGSLFGQNATTFRSRLYADALRRSNSLLAAHVRSLDEELLPRAAMTFTRLAIEEHVRRGHLLDEQLARAIRLIDAWRTQTSAAPQRAASATHHHGAFSSQPPAHQSQPLLNELQDKLSEILRRRLLLWKVDHNKLAGFDGELDRALQMPGWTNVWTMPIQNRVDMLSTGVNTTVGIRVMGRKRSDVVAAAEQVGAIVRKVPGAADVVVDPIRSKSYLDVRVNRPNASRLGVTATDVNRIVEAALGGTLVTTTIEGGGRRPVRVQLPSSWGEDEETLRRLPINARPAAADSNADHHSLSYVTLAEVADVRTSEGPAAIKSENGMLRTYVRANVRGRGSLDFVEQAQRAVAADARLPQGVHVEWTGQFESEARARRRLMVLLPIVVILIGVLLYATYRDIADALLILLAIPGAMAGGVLFQWLCGFNFSMTVWIGYIACFGMAAATGIIMLVYLREAVAKAGGLGAISLPQLRQAVLDGAVHRLRPKLLTEGTTIIGLAPMLWASGPGADVIRPMAAPVLGGILVADEVIDLLLPVLFYWVRRRRWLKLQSAPDISEAAASAPAASSVPAETMI